MSELIVREVTPRDKPAKYGGVDLGSKENLSRGAAATATLRRDIPDSNFIVCVTFLADTYHNRATLLEKSRSEKKLMEIFVRGDDGKIAPLTLSWLDEVFGSITEHALKLPKTLPHGASEDPHDAMDHDPDGMPDLPIKAALGADNVKEKIPKPAVSKPSLASKPAKGGKKGAAASGMPEAESVSIASLADFLGLPMRAQMAALESGMPQEFLAEIVASDSPALEMDVKNEAFKRMSVEE